MADQPTCSCGTTDALTVKRIIFPCAGVANTGQITNCAAIQLSVEGYGSPACIALLATGDEGLKKDAARADETLIPDGCPVACATKIANTQGIHIDQAIIVNKLGIAKAGALEYTDEDIEKVVSAVWEGIGRTGEAKRSNLHTDDDPNFTSESPGCGCGGEC